MPKNAKVAFINAYIALMDIQQIKYFLTLADELHFWKTAGRMHITQSALSRQIQGLERELGVQLLERDKELNCLITTHHKYAITCLKTLTQVKG